MDIVFLASLVVTVVVLIVRRGFKRKPKKPLTPAEQEKRDVADQVVVINETILK